VPLIRRGCRKNPLQKRRYTRHYELGRQHPNEITRNSISADVQKVQFAGYDLTPRSTILVLIDLIFEFYLKKVMK
jgi:hypothetical protein